MEFPWYTVLNNSEDLEQGDFFSECPILIPPKAIQEDRRIESELILIDSIILSQSCDLAHDKVQIVLVCPYFSLETFIDNLPDSQKKNVKQIRKHIDNLKKGFLPGYHLLNKSEEHKFNNFIVVDFRNVYGIQIETLKQIAKSLDTRIRLLPPYREHLSQAFARYFMRVGLPQDIEIDSY